MTESTIQGAVRVETIVDLRGDGEIRLVRQEATDDVSGERWFERVLDDPPTVLVDLASSHVSHHAPSKFLGGVIAAPNPPLGKDSVLMPPRQRID